MTLESVASPIASVSIERTSVRHDPDVPLDIRMAMLGLELPAPFGMSLIGTVGSVCAPHSAPVTEVGWLSRAEYELCWIANVLRSSGSQGTHRGTEPPPDVGQGQAIMFAGVLSGSSW